MKTFEEFLEDKFANGRADGRVTKDNYESMFESWLENLDVQELIDFGEEYGKYCIKQNEIDEQKKMGDDMFKENVIAGVDFKEPLDSLASITGIKLSDMLGKK